MSNPAIAIRYGVVKSGHGWVGRVTVNGRLDWTQWRPVNQQLALEMAEQAAFAESKRWVGDWDITVGEAD